MLHLLWPDAKALWLMQPNITTEHIAALETMCKNQTDQACIVQAQLLQDLYGFNFAQLALLGIYGLAFTYIASAPVLVMHAVRRNLFSKDEKRLSGSKSILSLFYCVAVFVFLLFGSAVISASNNIWFDFPDMLTILCFLILGLSGVYIFFQIVFLCFEYRNSKLLLDYYKRLHKARVSECIDVNSYKHLREHGNAFLLVIHNIMFLAVVFSIAHVFGSDWVLLAVLWVFPASGIYLLGHKIEAEMACDFSEKQTVSK